MRLLYVVQRYGPAVAGGAEGHCRDFATRMAARGHEVEVLTTCAVSYTDWANVEPAGDHELDGVVVHRLPVSRPREQRIFGDLDARFATPGFRPRWLEEEWMRLQGPDVPELGPWLEREAAGYDAVAVVTYLYNTAWTGLRAAHGRAPLVLHPTAHDESYLYLRLFDRMFSLPSAFAFLTPEEEGLVRRRFRARQPGAVVGVGADVGHGTASDGEEAVFRARHGLGDRPYLLYVGRFDVGKAADELGAYFVALKDRAQGPSGPSERGTGSLALVILGETLVDPPDHPDVVVTGFVDEAVKAGALAGATALVQPSYFESFGIVLLEAWAHGLPVLVQGRCDVLAGQVRRSGGGIPYEGFAEFEAAVEMLLADDGLRRGLGERGRAHLDAEYRWDNVLDRYERFLGEVVQGPSGPAA